jgi:type IV pilus biogenesis protein PilP
MKIADKKMKVGSWLFAIGCSVAPAAVWASDPGAAPAYVPASVAAPMTVTAVARPIAVAATPVITPVAVPAAAPVSTMAKPVPVAEADAMLAANDAPTDAETKMAEMPGAVAVPSKEGGMKADDLLKNAKVPESVRNVVKQLTVTSKDMTLEDLNAAREAVAKLDALLDIEKRLTDLEKIRKEREGKSFAEAIPASALMPVGGAAMQRGNAPMPMAAVTPDIQRIEGTNGHYAAVMKAGTGSKVVHVGDRLDDGSEVLAITADGVEVSKGKSRHLIRVKDVQGVFGSSP